MTLLPVSKRPYRSGVGIMLLNRGGAIFVAQRLDTPGAAWQMPQGGIDDGETPQDALFRELLEETGCQPHQVDVLVERSEWLSYTLPEELANKVWKGRYQGQRQKWFALAFLGQDTDIDLVSGCPEFSQWRWAKPEELPELAVSFKEDLYRDLMETLYPAACTLLNQKDSL